LLPQVTIQIDTDPPKMDDPTSLGSSDVNDLVSKMTKITKTFEIPVELLE
jgi:D-tyrosyl-tRNA(Tyr) deacylase